MQEKLYSYLNYLTGFAEAALIAWYATVERVIRNVITDAIMKTAGLILTGYLLIVYAYITIVYVNEQKNYCAATLKEGFSSRRFFEW